MNGLPETEQSTGADLVQDFAESAFARELCVFASTGAVGLVTAAIAAGIALRRNADAPVFVMDLLGLSGFLIAAHPPPFGPVGLVLFGAAVLIVVRSQSRAQATGPLGRPEFRVAASGPCQPATCTDWRLRTDARRGG